MQSFLRIGGITMRVFSDDARATWLWEEPTARFLIEPTESEIELEVRVGIPDSPPGSLLFDSGAVWRLYRRDDEIDDGFRFECRAEVFGDHPYKVAFFDPTFTRGVIHLRDDVAHLSPLDYPLDEVLIANLLGRGRGVELHSCGVIDPDGRGRLFVGVSGAGKTTTARLWANHATGIVSDDRVLVREHEGAMWMFGTPWHGEAELSMPGGVPLAGVYLLTQSTVNELHELAPAVAVARLFGCTFPPFYDEGSLDFILAFLERIVSAVPVRELRFTRDPEAVSVVLA